MDTFTNNNLKQLRSTIEKTLVSLQAETGVQFNLGNCKYDNYSATFQLKASLNNEQASAAKQKEVNTCAELLGFPGEYYGKEFTFQGKRYQITDINLNRPKYPVSAKSIVSGKGYKFPKEVLNTISEVH